MATMRGIAAATGIILAAACQTELTRPSVAPVPRDSKSVQPTGTGFIAIRGVAVPVTFEVWNGRGIWQGDIDLGPVDRIARTAAALWGPELGIFQSGPLWPNGRVPYEFAPGYGAQQAALDAMAHIHSNVKGISFAPKTIYDADYVRFDSIDTAGHPGICGQAGVGKLGGAQLILFRSSCAAGGLIHELEHVLGALHEQSRCDRDTYITVYLDSILPADTAQFHKVCLGEADVGTYDEGSIMHYGTHHLGKFINGDTARTIRSKRGLDSLMGQLSGLSAGDIYTLYSYYPKSPPVINNITYPSGTPTVSFSAADPAINFTLKYKVIYYQYNYYENWSNISDYSVETVGYTTGLSLADSGRSYTGTNRCYVVQNQDEEWYMYHEYEITATYSTGNSTATTVYHLPALVATEDCF